VSGRKRHLAVDTNGFLVLPDVTGAEVQDRDAADVKKEQPTLRHVRADQGDAGELVDGAREQLGVAVEIVRRSAAGVVVQAKRWIVERTIAWIGRSRRMARDVGACAETTEAWTYPATIRLMLRRVCPPRGRTPYAAV
jgi:putative transposase